MITKLFLFFVIASFLAGCGSGSGYDDRCRIKLIAVLDLVDEYYSFSDSSRVSDAVMSDDFFSIYDDFRACFIEVRPRDTKVMAGNLDIHVRLIRVRLNVGLVDDDLIGEFRALHGRLNYINNAVMEKGEFRVAYYYKSFLDGLEN